MNLKQMEQVRQRAHEAFIPFDGVLGVGYGMKQVKGRNTDTPAIVVFVEKKLPRRKIKRGQLIPKAFADLATDIQEVRFDRERVEKDSTGLYEDSPMAQFLDWAKIHDLTIAQNRRRTRKTRGTKKPRIRGNDSTADTPPPPPATEVRGNLFIVEDHGTLTLTTSNGTKLIDLVGAWNLFRGQFGDDYDFAVFFLDNTDTNFPNMGNFSESIFHDASENGFGVSATNNRATWNNSNRLLREACHSWYSLRTMLHEIGHQWLFFINYRNSAGGQEQTLLHESWDPTWSLGQKWYHPGRWADNDRSCMGYAHTDWIEIAQGNPGVYRQLDLGWADGSLTLAGPDADFNFSPLDQYLMGFVDPGQVASSHVSPPAYPASVTNYQIINNAAERSDHDFNSTPVSITSQNIIWNEGARLPDHHHSQRVFHQAVIAVTYNRTNSAQFLTDSQTRLANQATNWRRATSGRSVMDTSLLRSNINDIYIRDNTNDVGGVFPGGTFWDSPDIFVRTHDDDPNQFLNPNTSNGSIHEEPKSNQDNWIYARISNKGLAAYSNVTVNFYCANYMGFSGHDTAAQAIPRTEVIYPIDWHPDSRIGTATLPSIPAGGTAVAKVVWPKDMIPPKPGWHPCILVEVIPQGTAPSGLHNVWENKKIAQKNITIDYVQADEYELFLPFLVGHLESAAPFGVVEIAKPLDVPDLQVNLDPGKSLGELHKIGGKYYHRIPSLEEFKGIEPWSELSVTPEHSMVPAKLAGDQCSQIQNDAIEYPRFVALPVEGFEPQHLGEKTILHMTDRNKACFPIPLGKERSFGMKLQVCVNGRKLKQPVTLHVVQRNYTGRIVGGIDVQLRPKIRDGNKE